MRQIQVTKTKECDNLIIEGNNLFHLKEIFNKNFRILNKIFSRSQLYCIK